MVFNVSVEKSTLQLIKFEVYNVVLPICSMCLLGCLLKAVMMQFSPDRAMVRAEIKLVHVDIGLA